mmetsp:Transcript_47141/g.143288  ORF Transcript_47141/g.143288 Transcript_47141/m.143288 type:complete len:281 (+) Transcript_47141:140-982(+)
MVTCKTPSLNVHVASSACVAAKSSASISSSPLTNTFSLCLPKVTWTAFLSPFWRPSRLKVTSTSSPACRHLYWSVSPVGAASCSIEGSILAGFLTPAMSANLDMSPTDLFSRCFLVATTQGASVLMSFAVKSMRLHSSSVSSNTRPMKQSPLKVWPAYPQAWTRPDTRGFSSRFFAMPLSSQYTLIASQLLSLVGSITGKISTLVAVRSRSMSAPFWSFRSTPVLSCNCLSSTLLSTSWLLQPTKYCSTNCLNESSVRSCTSCSYTNSCMGSFGDAGTSM